MDTMLTHAPEARPAIGFHLAFYPEDRNHCPGCGRSNWYVGRCSAQCAFCDTALPIATAARSWAYDAVASQA